MAIGAAQKWYIGAAAASAAVLGAGWFLLVSPQYSTADEINAQAQTVQSANQATELQIAALKAEYKDLPAVQSQVAAIRTRIPQTPNEPSLIRTLTAAANASGVTMKSVSFQAPAPVAGVAANAATGTAGGLLANPGQVNQIGLAIQISGSFADTRMFLNKLEGMQRAMLVTALDISRSEGDGQTSELTTAIQARAFMANPGTVSSSATTTTTTAPAAPSADQAS
jgi:Tfp pilus assembly protein PilO